MLGCKLKNKIIWITKINKINEKPTIFIANEFFDAIAAEVDSVSFLAYCRDELSDILESIVIEELLLPADMPVRIGLDASHQIGRNSDDNSENDVECETWESLLDLNKTRGFIEDAEHNTDTHSLDELMRIHFGE